MASRSRAATARQIRLLHNIFFALLLPDSFDQEHQSICFTPERGWREQGGSCTGIPLALPGLLPSPGSLQGHSGTRSYKVSLKIIIIIKISPPFPGTTSHSWPGSADNEQFGLKIQARAKDLPKPHRDFPRALRCQRSLPWSCGRSTHSRQDFAPSEMRCWKGKHL